MKGERIKALDGLRALAIIEVVLYHLNVSVCDGMVTRLVITFFFILSGYLMAMHYGDIEANLTGIKRIFTRRIAHFLPLYWLTLIALLIFSAWGFRWDLPFHVLLLQSLIPHSYYCFSYNVVGWFISVLLICYICFPLLNGIFRRVSLRAQITMLIIVGAVYHIMLYLLQPNGDYIYYICPVTRIFDFAAGMTLFRALESWHGNRKRLSMPWATVLEIVTIAVIIGCNMLVNSIPNSLRMVQYTLLWYIPVLMLIAVMGHRSMASGIFSRVLSWPIFVKVGMLSMEIYVLHYLTIGLVRKAVEASQIAMPVWIFTIVALLVTLAAAMLAHRFITIPVKNWISRHCNTVKNSQSN